jgi:hypothetical protein
VGLHLLSPLYVITFVFCAIASLDWALQAASQKFPVCLVRPLRIFMLLHSLRILETEGNQSFAISF